MRTPKKLPREVLEPHLFPDVPFGEKGPVVDWQQVFGNTHPVEIEVGFGKGLFLISEAMKHPERNFFGIEVMRKLQLYVAQRAFIRNLKNVKLACADARTFLQDRVLPQSVETIHVYFPDPWWKARHKKRRVFTPEFAESAARVLIPNGLLKIATDVEEYFAVMTEIARNRKVFLEEPVVQAQEPVSLASMTNFERKAFLKGTRIWRTQFRRI